MNQENEKFVSAWGQVQLYANSAWAPESNDDFISANQRLWSQKRLHEFNTRQSQVQNALTEKPQKPQSLVRDENLIRDNIAGHDETRLSVKDVIPESRLACFYGNFYYDEERESCYTADVDVKSSFVSKPPLDDDKDENLECWMLPEVDYWFQKLIGKHDEPFDKTEETIVEPTIITSSFAEPENLDCICQDLANVSTSQLDKLMNVNGENLENQKKFLKLREEEQEDFPLPPTTKQGRNIPGWLFQLDAMYPELKLPDHLANVTINISFSFFACENITLKPSVYDLLKPGITNALYVPTLESDEEKILYRKVYGKDVRNVWHFRPYLLVGHGGRIQPIIQTPIFPLTPDLTSALERALQNFKVHMKNIYSSNDPFNKQKKPTPILPQSRKIIQSRHRHKPPRIQSAFKSNLLNVEAPEFFPNPQMIKSHQDALRSSLYELFPKAWPQNNLLKTVNIIKNINNKFISLGGAPRTGKSTSENPISPQIIQQNLYYNNLVNLYQHTINCCKQNHRLLKADNKILNQSKQECDKYKSKSAQKTNAYKSYPIIPITTSGALADMSQHQKLIPVYQKPPETYSGRLTKNVVSSSSNNINNSYSASYGSNNQNNNLILLTNSKKNKLKEASKTRSLENIKISSESQQRVDLFLDPQKTNECTSQENAVDIKNSTEHNRDSCEPKNVYQRSLGHHSKMTRNLSFGSHNSLSSKNLIDNLSGEKNINGKGSSRMFPKECNNLCTDKKGTSSNYSRRRKKDFKDGKNETEIATKKPIILLRKTSTPPAMLSTSPNKEVTGSPREHQISPLKNVSPQSCLQTEIPQWVNSPKAKSAIVNEVGKQSNETKKKAELMITYNKFMSDAHIPIKNTNKKNMYTFSRKKKVPGPTVTEITNVMSGRRLYSAVLSNSPHINFPQTSSISCESFSQKFPLHESDLNVLHNKPSISEPQKKGLYSVAENQCLCSSEETIYWTDAHFENLEREALEQYTVSDESINKKLEELETQAIEQYSGTSNSNTSCGGCSSPHKLTTSDSIFNDKTSKSANQITKAIDSVVIYSTVSASSKSSSATVNKKSKNFKTAGNKSTGKHNKKKNSKPLWTSPRTDKSDEQSKRM